MDTVLKKGRFNDSVKYGIDRGGDGHPRLSAVLFDTYRGAATYDELLKGHEGE